MTRDETYFSGHLTWDGQHFQSHHVFALFLKSFLKLLFNTKGRNRMGFCAHSCDWECTGTCFSLHLFVVAWFKGTHGTALPPAASAWPGLVRAAAAGPWEQEWQPSLIRCHRQPRGHCRFVFSTFTSHALFSCRSFHPTAWSWCRRAWKRRKWFKFQNSRKKKNKQNRDFVLSGFQKHLTMYGAS